MRPTHLLVALSVFAAACSGASDPLSSAGSGSSSGSASGGGTTVTGSDDGGGASVVVTPGEDAGAGNEQPGTDGGGTIIVESDGGHVVVPSGDGGTTPGTDAGAPSTGSEYAPYFPTWVWGGSGYAFTSLVDLQKKTGIPGVTIAFVLSNGGCDTTQDIEQNLSDVKAFIAAGGHVKASFGGADGTYVENKCSDATSLANAIQGFVDATGITDLDFDVEQGPAETDAINTMRGQALKMVQDARHVQVAFTLPANPSPGGGLDSSGQSVVSHAVSAGVVIHHVNFMTMDYGDGFGGKPLAPVVTGTLNDGHTQIMSLIPGISSADAWKVVGVIPMIGKNDDSEVFSLDDATTTATFCETNHVGLVSFWSIDRDQPGSDYNTSSTVESTAFAFNAILSATAK
jgi:chitinase